MKAFVPRLFFALVVVGFMISLILPSKFKGPGLISNTLSTKLQNIDLDSEAENSSAICYSISGNKRKVHLTEK